MAGLGGDGSWLIGGNDTITAINASGPASDAATRSDYAQLGYDEIPECGSASALGAWCGRWVASRTRDTRDASMGAIIQGRDNVRSRGISTMRWVTLGQSGSTQTERSKRVLTHGAMRWRSGFDNHVTTILSRIVSGRCGHL